MVRLAALAAGAFFLATPAKASFVLTFASVPAGQTPLSLTATDGNVLTFSSPSDPGGFAVSNALPFSNAPGFTGTGFVAGQGLVAVASTGPASLTISFARPVSNISFTFEFKDATGTNLLTTRNFSGATLGSIGTFSTTGTDGQFPIGQVQDAPFNQTFTSVTVSGTVPFGIANLTNTDASVAVPGPVGVPEPVTFAVLGAGLLGLAAARRRV